MLNLRSRHGFSMGEGKLDRGTVGGIGLALLFIIAAVALGGKWGSFLNPASLLIIVGGTFGATLANFSQLDLTRSWLDLRQTLHERGIEPRERIAALVSLSQQVRADGMLVLEQAAQLSGDGFFRKALTMAADGQPAVDVRRILDIESRMSVEKSGRAVQVFESMGSYAPAMGLIGTLIGLIQMLGSLQDPSVVGAAMANALVATLYGAMLANLIFLPLAGKLRNRMEENFLVKSLTIEGIISVMSLENPMVVEQRLQSFLPNVVNL